MERELRRAQDNLVISGKGALIFGLWNLVQIAMYSLFAPDYLRRMFDIDPNDTFSYVLTTILWIILSLIIIAIRGYVKKSAIREAMAGTGKFYLFLTGFLCLFSASSLVQNLFFSAKQNAYDLLSIIILETASVLNLAAVVSSGIRVRRLRRRIGEEASHAG